MERASEGRVPELGCRLAGHRVSARHRDKAQATAPQVLLCLAGVPIRSLVHENNAIHKREEIQQTVLQ